MLDAYFISRLYMIQRWLRVVFSLILHHTLWVRLLLNLVQSLTRASGPYSLWWWRFLILLCDILYMFIRWSFHIIHWYIWLPHSYLLCSLFLQVRGDVTIQYIGFILHLLLMLLSIRTTTYDFIINLRSFHTYEIKIIILKVKN